MSKSYKVLDDQGNMVTLKVGDWIGFKYDHEQEGQITSFRWDYGILYITVTAVYDGHETTRQLQAGQFWTV